MLSSLKQVVVGLDRRMFESLLAILVLLTAALMLLPNDHFSGISDEDESIQGKLLPRLHLAMSTVSTVGYGDVVPRSPTARAICMVAQLLMMLEIHSSIRLALEDRHIRRMADRTA